MLNLYALIFFFPLLAYGQQWIVRNPVDATFRIGSSKGSPYKSIGASLYPYWVGSTDQRYTYRLMSAGKANGLSSFRAILIFEQLNGQPSVDALWTGTIWSPIDIMLANANLLDVHITLELSGLANWMQSNQMDPYDPVNYWLWDQLVDFVTNRINAINGIPYAEDPAIFAYSVLGEVLPSPRSQQPRILQLLTRVSARLKQRDSKHLVGSGGLLHMSPYSGYNDPVQYWKQLYSDQSVDFCMVHIYQGPGSSVPSTDNYDIIDSDKLPVSEWTLLAGYAQYCRSIGKPFVVDEFGLQTNQFDRRTVYRYFDYAFASAMRADVPVIQIWNWAPGATFDIYQGNDLLVIEVIRKWSILATNNSITPRRLATLQSLDAALNPNTALIGNMSATKLNSKLTFDFGSISPSQAVEIIQLSDGNLAAVEFSFDFPSFQSATAQLSFNNLPITSRDWSQYAQSDGKLICDAMVRASPISPEPAGLMARFTLISASGRQYTQSPRSVWFNYITLNGWNQIVVRLDPSLIRQEFVGVASSGASNWLADIKAIRTVQMTLVHQPNLPRVVDGRLYIKNCRLTAGGASLLGTDQIYVWDQCTLADNRPIAAAEIALMMPLNESSGTGTDDENSGIIDEDPRINYARLLDNNETVVELYRLRFIVGCILYLLSAMLLLLAWLLHRKRKHVSGKTPSGSSTEHLISS